MKKLILKNKDGSERQVWNKFDLEKDTKDVNAFDKVFEALGLLDMMTNADEAMQTVLTGFGEELVPIDVLSDEVIDLTTQEAKLLSFLPGDHGRNMPKSGLFPIVGEPGYMQGNTEWDGSTTSIAVGNTKLPTAEVQITQAPLIMSIPVSKRELTYSVIDLESLLKTKISKAAARTIESMIINGDSELGATGNVNSDDQLPATTFAAVGGTQYHVLLQDHGIRELAINGSGLTHDVGTLIRADFTSIENIIGEFMGEDALWICNQRVLNTISALDDFSDASKRGADSTLNGNAVANIDGADLHKTREVPLTEADGKESGATPAGNTLGQLLLIYRAAVQYGWGQALEIDVVKIPGKGIQIIATMEFGFTIVQLKAGQVDSSVAAGINITV